VAATLGLTTAAFTLHPILTRVAALLLAAAILALALNAGRIAWHLWNSDPTRS
jgi:hypothetical protein